MESPPHRHALADLPRPAACSAAGGPVGMVFNIQRYAIHDGPGIRTTVFLKGCPLRCAWCHNPESYQEAPEHAFRANRCLGCGRCVQACPVGAISQAEGRVATELARCTFCGSCVEVCLTGAREIVGRLMSVAEVLAEVRRDVPFYDQSGGGVTFSGGEPLLQPAFLRELLARCNAREIHTALDTSCYAPWDVIDSLDGLVDLYLCDLKHMDPNVHRRSTGVSNELILQNLRRLAESGNSVVIRLPVIPGLNDDADHVAAVGHFVSSLPGVSEIDILPYNQAGRAKSARLAGDSGGLEVEAPSNDRVNAIAEALRAFGLTVRIGG